MSMHTLHAPKDQQDNTVGDTVGNGPVLPHAPEQLGKQESLPDRDCEPQEVKPGVPCILPPRAPHQHGKALGTSNGRPAQRWSHSCWQRPSLRGTRPFTRHRLPQECTNHMVDVILVVCAPLQVLSMDGHQVEEELNGVCLHWVRVPQLGKVGHSLISL